MSPQKPLKDHSLKSLKSIPVEAFSIGLKGAYLEGSK